MRSITSFARRVTGDSASQRKWLMLRLVMLLFTAMTTSATWADTDTFKDFTNKDYETRTGTNVKYSLSAKNVSFEIHRKQKVINNSLLSPRERLII